MTEQDYMEAAEQALLFMYRCVIQDIDAADMVDACPDIPEDLPLDQRARVIRYINTATAKLTCHWGEEAAMLQALQEANDASTPED